MIICNSGSNRNLLAVIELLTGHILQAFVTF